MKHQDTAYFKKVNENGVNRVSLIELDRCVSDGYMQQNYDTEPLCGLKRTIFCRTAIFHTMHIWRRENQETLFGLHIKPRIIW